MLSQRLEKDSRCFPDCEALDLWTSAHNSWCPLKDANKFQPSAMSITWYFQAIWLSNNSDLEKLVETTKTNLKQRVDLNSGTDHEIKGLKLLQATAQETMRTAMLTSHQLSIQYAYGVVGETRDAGRIVGRGARAEPRDSRLQLQPMSVQRSL
ncbi:hypothetical protein G7Y89_g1502 [Cudoniella acicularis]|uniref:Uncharacterized protein n=1 Tax=Cudoniella acicularis TaxID=354080 RepID=A0A8H4W6Y2_9HELO|nr:hypothetical protein G7Y89_g1502 [Cudoniella acicularis]